MEDREVFDKRQKALSRVRDRSSFVGGVTTWLRESLGIKVGGDSGSDESDGSGSSDGDDVFKAKKKNAKAKSKYAG